MKEYLVSEQICNDEKIISEFKKLQEKLISYVIQFCILNNVKVTDVFLDIINLEKSIKEGSWQAETDASMQAWLDNKLYMYI